MLGSNVRFDGIKVLGGNQNAQPWGGSYCEDSRHAVRHPTRTRCTKHVWSYYIISRRIISDRTVFLSFERKLREFVRWEANLKMEAKKIR